MKKIVFALIAVCVLLLGCQGKKDDNVIKIGAILPLTGSYADVGQWIMQGMKIAADKINNENNGYKVEVYYADSEGKTTKAISAYNNLKMTSKPQFYMTTVSPIAIALKPLMQKDSVLSIVQSAHKDVIGNDCPLIFRYCLTIKQEATCINSSMETTHKIDTDSRIALLYVNNEIGNEFKEEFLKTTNYSNVHSISYESSDMDLKNIVISTLNFKPDYIVISGYTKNYGLLVKRLREAGFTSKIFANQGFSTESVREAAGKAGNNVFYDDYYLPYNTKTEELAKLLSSEYNVQICPMHITSYNMVYMIVNSCNQIGVISPQSVVKYWRTTNIFNVNGSELSIQGTSQDIAIPIQLKENIYEF